ncbi:MAG: cytochrome c peroxidase [Gemmatimonadota bacterium]
MKPRVMPFLALMLLYVAACGTGERVAGKAGTAFALEIPAGLDGAEIYIPGDNPLTVEKVALGKLLYFDKRLSLDSTVACASCHNPRFGFTDLGRARA